MKPLFLVLARQPFDWFKEGSKKFELREEKIKYNRNTIIKRRTVTVQRSRYKKGGRFNGVIGKIEIGTLTYLLKKLPYKKVIPASNSVEDAIKIIKKAGYIKNSKKCIAFEIKNVSKIYK